MFSRGARAAVRGGAARLTCTKGQAGWPRLCVVTAGSRDVFTRALVPFANVSKLTSFVRDALLANVDVTVSVTDGDAGDVCCRYRPTIYRSSELR